MTNIVIMAPKGKMDKLVVEAANKRDNINIVAGVGPKGRDYIGEDIGRVAGLAFDVGAPVVDNLENVIADCDVIVDFSSRELSLEVLNMAIKHKKALICGTTGFTEAENMKFLEASKTIPMLKAANTSYMVNVMNKLLSITAKALKDKVKIEIIDMHDQDKKDAPSGTAKEMADIIKDSSDMEVTFHSVRAGDISSSHNIIFGGYGERLEITHHAYNWKGCAEGACDAIEYLNGKEPGLYSMEDVVKF